MILTQSYCHELLYIEIKGKQNLNTVTSFCFLVVPCSPNLPHFTTKPFHLWSCCFWFVFNFSLFYICCQYVKDYVVNKL